MLYQLPDLQGSVTELAYQPCEVGTVPDGRAGLGATAFTSMFMHGGWAHLLGNMLFLWIFGNNVEDALGRVRYLFLYLVGGLAATAARRSSRSPSRATPTRRSRTSARAAQSRPCSARYFLLLPRAKVLTMIFFILREVPAVLFLGIWFGFQLLDGGTSSPSGAGGGVAFFAHIGGFVFGFLTVKLVQQRRAALAPVYCR